MNTSNLPEKFDYKIHVGPVHPTHKEPIRFTFFLRGEYVEKVDLRLGYNHKGIEKAFEARTYIQNLFLVAHICGTCSNSHQLAYVQNIEKCTDLYYMVPERAHWLRVIASEMERIQAHMLWYGVLAHDAGFDTLWHAVWRDREIILDLLEKWVGNRVHYSICCFGGVRRDLSEVLRLEFIKSIKQLKHLIEIHKKITEEEKSYGLRLKGVAILSKEDALAYSAVGPTARASAVHLDVRFDDPYAIYSELEAASFNRIIYNNGDIFDINRVRLDESLSSCEMILYCLENLPNGEYRMKDEFPRQIEANESFQRVEAHGGENLHYVRSNDTNKPDRYKIRAPTLANLMSLKYRLVGCEAADIPVVIRSIDPCISCAERTTYITNYGLLFVKLDSGKQKIVREDELRAKSIITKRYNKKLTQLL